MDIGSCRYSIGFPADFESLRMILGGLDKLIEGVIDTKCFVLE